MNINYLEQANEQFYNKNYQAALENYNLAIKHCPSMPEAYYCRGLVKRIMGDHKEAIQDLSIATILNPKMVLAYYYRGICYYETGDYAYAIANYNHAIFLEPQLANAYYHRAIIYGELGRIASALKDFKHSALLAKKQDNLELYQRAKKAQVLAKKFKNTHRYNGILVGIFKITLVATILGVAFGHLKYLKNNQIDNQEINQTSLIEYFKDLNN